jgi:hypothetical protein
MDLIQDNVQFLAADSDGEFINARVASLSDTFLHIIPAPNPICLV